MKMCKSAQTGKYIRALLGYDISNSYNPGNYKSGEMAWFEKRQSGKPFENINHTMALMVKDVNVFDPR